jgi:hypothetical protein
MESLEVRMIQLRWRAILITALVAMVLSTCSKKGKDAKHHYVELAEVISPEDSFPRLRYYDSNLVTINDRCAVRKVRLNPKMPAVYVNGQPVGFC